MKRAHFIRLIQATAAGALIAPLAAHAQEAAPDTSPPPAQIVVTALTRLPTPLAQAPDAYVITAQDIQAKQAIFAGDVLSSVPGVSVVQGGAFGGLTSVSIRGASSDKTLVLVNGVPVNDITSPEGAYDFGSFDLGDVSRIEVLTGPQSVLWGSDAIGGVVAITTAEPKGASVALEGGAFDTWRTVAQAGWSTDRWAFGATFSEFSTAGISAADVHDNYGPYGYPGLHNSEPDGDDDATVDLSGRFTPIAAVQFDGQVRWNRSRTDIDGFPATYGYFLFTDTNDVAVSESLEAFVRAKVEGPFGLKNEFSVSDYQIERGDHGEGGDYGYRGDQQAYRWTIARGGADDLISFVAGVERDQSSATLSTGDRFDLGETSAFALAQLHPVKALTLTGGARYDAPDRFHDQATFRAGAVYALPYGLSVHASLNQGFKTPTISETACDFCYTTPVPLQPEHAQGYDGGLGWSTKDGRISLTATAYHLDVTDQIAYVAGRYVNIAHTVSNGIELKVDAALPAGFRIEAAYGYTDAVDAGTGVDLLRIPHNSGSATLFWTHGKFDATLTVRAESDDLDTGLDGLTPVVRPGFVVADLAAGYDVNAHIRLTARIENLANARYEEEYGYGEPGTAVYLGIKLKT